MAVLSCARLSSLCVPRGTMSATSKCQLALAPSAKASKSAESNSLVVPHFTKNSFLSPREIVRPLLHIVRWNARFNESRHFATAMKRGRSIANLIHIRGKGNKVTSQGRALETRLCQSKILEPRLRTELSPFHNMAMFQPRRVMTSATPVLTRRKGSSVLQASDSKGSFLETEENERNGGLSTAEETNNEEIFSSKKEVQGKQKKNEVWTLPTMLTLVRVAAVPAIIPAFYASPVFAAVIFVVASITDWLDGYLARKMGLSSSFGAFLDPVADKLMVAAALVLLCTELPAIGLPLWTLPAPSIAIIGREITMSAVREWAAAQGGKLHEAVAVSSLGKWKTATQMVALTALLFARIPNLLEPSSVVSNIVFGGGIGLLYIASGLALWSLALYFRVIWRAMQ